MKNVLPFILLILCACNSDTNTGQSTIEDLINQLDKTAKVETFNESKVKELLPLININLTNSEVKNRDLENGIGWTTNATFKWNADSSIIMIQSTKAHVNGFKRETILNVADSLILIIRFETLTEDQASKGYEIIETLDYLSSRKDRTKMIRRMFPASLSDTIDFKRMNLKPYESNIKNHFPGELEYARKFMNHN